MKKTTRATQIKEIKKEAKLATKQIIRITPTPKYNIINGMKIMFNKRLGSRHSNNVNFAHMDIQAFKSEYDIPVYGNGVKITKILLKDQYNK